MTMSTRVNGVLVTFTRFEDTRPGYAGMVGIDSAADLPRVPTYASYSQASGQTLAVIDAAFHGQADAAEDFVFCNGWMTATLADLEVISRDFLTANEI